MLTLSKYLSARCDDSEGGDSRKDGHYHHAQVLIFVQLKTMAQHTGSGTEIV